MEVISQSNNMERIGFGMRFGAVLIDGIIISAIAFILGMIGLAGGSMLGAAAGAAAGQTADSALGGGIAGAIMGFIAGATIAAFLYSLLEAFTGYTLGKLMLGIRVKNEDGTEGNTGLYLKRWAIKNIGTVCNIAAMVTGVGFISSIGGLLGFVMFIGCFFALGDKRQALHDTIAKTAVFRK
ncbi:MAG: RDD family protein [Bacteroidetes bacterium]|nr:RDD family protein [Bacteroidota bacterium]